MHAQNLPFRDKPLIISGSFHIFFCSIPDFGSMLWNVPVTIATKGNPEAAKFVLDKVSDTVTIEGVGPDDYILVSLQAVCGLVSFPDHLREIM